MLVCVPQRYFACRRGVRKDRKQWTKGSGLWAVEQEREILRRRAEQEKVHDAILSSLPTCMGRNADGTPCTRKANPGHHYCHLHLDNEK